MKFKKLIKNAPITIALLLVVNIMLVGLLISIADKDTQEQPFSDDDNPEITTTPDPFATQTPAVSNNGQMILIEIGERIPGTTEEIDIYAQPLTPEDSVAMIRLYVKNGEVLSFKSAGLMAFGTCIDGKQFVPERVCVDIAKSTPFEVGEKLGTIKIKWSINGNFYTEEGHGYFNGQEVSFTNQSVGNVAGIDTESNEYFAEGVILITVSVLILCAAMAGAYLILSQDGPKTNLKAYNKGQKTIKVLVGASVVTLAGATVFVANMIATKNQAPESANAFTTPTPLYITVTVLPADEEQPIITITPTEVFDDVVVTTPPVTTAVTSVVPTTTVILTPTVTSTPSPTPFTDNVPMVCGPLDSNGDSILNYIDYQAMIYVYNHSCSDSYPRVDCGGKDTNEDGVINYIDMHYLVTHQFPTYTDCTRY